MTSARHCRRCSCPLSLLWIPGDGVRERRTRCARCARLPLATPCAVRDCSGSAVDKPGARLCAGCRYAVDNRKRAACSCGSCERCRKRAVHAAWQAANRERVRASNRASYALHAEQRLEQRRERATVAGDAIRAAARARYAVKRGGAVRQYTRQPGAQA